MAKQRNQQDYGHGARRGSVPTPMSSTGETSTGTGVGAAPGDEQAWQERLLPLMVRVVIGLAIFFFVSSLLQLAYLQWQLHQQLPNILTTMSKDQAEGAGVDVEAWLESDLITRRYRMASTLMMGQLWIRYLGFVTGMIMAIIGATFILGKLRESTSEVKAESTAIRVSIATASPGILLAVVGSGLMLATILTKQETWVKDEALYLSGQSPVSGSQKAPVTQQIEDLISDSKGREHEGRVIHE